MTRNAVTHQIKLLENTMTDRTSIIILFMLVTCATCFGQSSYKGLTPGKDTKAQAERVLGQPVKVVSPTLFEYKEPEALGVDKIYIQYREASSAAIIERIEFVCDYPGRAGDRRDRCSDIWSHSVSGRMYADLLEKTSSDVFKTTRYVGLPSLTVRTWSKNGNETIQSRLGFYSVDLFDSVVPKSCTGTFLGEWETNRGRLVLTDIPGSLN